MGIGPGLLEEDFRKYGWMLQPCWIKELWRFLDETNGTIRLTDDWDQQRCANDKFLMRIVHEMALLKEQIRKINLCRLYKRVTFMSEIIHHDQTSYHSDLWKSDVKLSSNVTERFPIIEVPTNYWPL